jgi:hypothetical protein
LQRQFDDESSKRMAEFLDKLPEWAYQPSTTDLQEVLCIYQIGGVRLDLSALHHRHGQKSIKFNNNIFTSLYIHLWGIVISILHIFFNIHFLKKIIYMCVLTD